MKTPQKTDEVLGRCARLASVTLAPVLLFLLHVWAMALAGWARTCARYSSFILGEGSTPWLSSKRWTFPGCVTGRRSLKHRIEELTKVIKVYTLLSALASINISTKCFFIKAWHVAMKTFQVAYLILSQGCVNWQAESREHNFVTREIWKRILILIPPIQQLLNSFYTHIFLTDVSWLNYMHLQMTTDSKSVVTESSEVHQLITGSNLELGLQRTHQHFGMWQRHYYPRSNLPRPGNRQRLPV